MPRGKTTIYLKGGMKDGEILADAPTRLLTDHLRVISGSGFTQEPDGKVGIFTDAYALPENWISYKSLLYRKLPNDPHKEGVVYEFVEDLIIDRCTSLTKASRRCKNEAEDGSTVCKVHGRQQA